MPMLEIRNLTKYFGGLAAVSGLDLEISESEILGIIGPNGAGKSTLFNIICGFLKPLKGQVMFRGEDITKLQVHDRAARGIGRTFQLSNLFMKSTVLDNVLTGFHLNYRVGLWRTFFHTRSARKEEEVAKQEAMEILRLMGLDASKNELAQNLPHGFQRILGICIALATHPRLLLLDEPVAGMNEVEITTMTRLIRQLRSRGTTIALVEHNMLMVKNVCERIVVLNHGRKIAEGSPEDALRNQSVIEAYVGKGEE